MQGPWQRDHGKDHELVALPLMQVPQKVKLWGFPESAWADSTCTGKPH